MDSLVFLEIQEEFLIYKFWSDVETSFKDSNNVQETDIESALKLLKLPFQTKRCSDFSNIDFNKPEFVSAYLRYYSAAHFVITRIAAEEFMNRCLLTCPLFYRKVFTTPKLKIVSVGGGPGNDLYGFCSALSGWRRFCCFPGCLLKNHLELSIMDKQDNWNSAAKIAHKKFHSKSKNSVMTHPSPPPPTGYIPKPPTYSKVDFTSAKEVEDVRSTLKSADVILMVKVLSVMEKQTKNDVLKEILKSLSLGSIFFYVDTEKNRVLEAVHQLNSEQKLYFYSILYNIESRQFQRRGNLHPQTMTHSTFEVCVVQKCNADCFLF